jgi:hypothetical protein
MFSVQCSLPTVRAPNRVLMPDWYYPSIQPYSILLKARSLMEVLLRKTLLLLTGRWDRAICGSLVNVQAMP